jgi:hypothetical protein
MLVWLASYPRSGNHLLRTILQRCFELGSYQIYQKAVRPMRPESSALIGARRFDDDSPEAFVARARSSSELFLVKTHDPVPDSDSCIYVVRDARAALVSYRRFLAEVEGHQSTLPNLIAGRHWPGKWQEHVRRFLSRDPANTLVLRYEELASDTPPLDQIGNFLNMNPIRPFDVSFSSLHQLSPKIFPTGNNRIGIETIERDHRELFWRTCGETMRALGYGAEDDGPAEQRSISFLRLPGCERPFEVDGHWAVVSGFGALEGPFPEMGLDEQYHWTVAQQAALDVFSMHRGRRTILLELSSMIRHQKVTIRLGGGPPVQRTLRGRFPKALALAIEHDFDAGPCRVEIGVDRCLETAEGRKLGVILRSVRFEPDAPRKWLRFGYRGRPAA